jgi:hypothetical protein
LFGGNCAVGAGHHRNAKAVHGGFGSNFVPHQPDVVGAGANKCYVMFGDYIDEARILRQKPIARVNGIGVGDLSGRNDRRDIQIAVGGSGRADANCFVGQAYMHGFGVRRGMDCNGLDAHFVARPMNA